MRPSTTVARAALIAALALGALPGLVGSREPNQDQSIDAALFGQVYLATTRDRHGDGLFIPDAADRSESALADADVFSEPDPGTMSGYASFYDHGTTAMRNVPMGTTIVICGAAGCIETVVSDYGPGKSTGRIIDMYRPDFFRICGCASSAGTTWVTIRIQ